MVNKKSLGLKGKLLLPITLLSVVGISSILAIILIYTGSSMKKMSAEMMSEMNQHYTSEIKGQLNSAMSSVESLMPELQKAGEAKNVDRQYFVDLFKVVLENNENILGIYTCWEPNAFDGKDAQYVGAPGHDSSGRYIPYVVRNDSGISVEALVDYDLEGTGDYYQIPKKTGVSSVIDPYAYTIDNESVMVTSMVVPIMINGRFAGIVGADILVDTITENVKSAELFDSGYILITDSQGKIIEHPQQDLLGQSILDIIDESNRAAVSDSLMSGNSTSFETQSTLNGKTNTIMINPVKMGGKNWLVGSVVPSSEISKPITKSLSMGIILGLLIILLTIVIVFYTVNKIIKRIKVMVWAADKLAEGDMDIDVNTDSRDEIGNLAKSLKTMAENNNEVLTNINAAAEQVAAGSKQISDSSISLSQGATEQASSIEELTASIEEIAAQTRKNTEHAHRANELAEKARENGAQGNNHMKEMLKAMDEINESSSNISKIIKVIDEIAFQTNILALNAAVEAARAGQHGKGFAVVAGEVRNLAARSANAAKETAEMIDGSINKVKGGTKIANETAGALNTIVAVTDEVASLVNDIATASNEQSIGINQINQGIMQVSQVVQSNSASSEESAAASEELSAQAKLLKQQVEKFKLKKTTRYSFNEQPGVNVSPKVLKKLDSASVQKKAPLARPIIALDDKEFDKY